jgi:hypothetical protein
MPIEIRSNKLKDLYIAKSLDQLRKKAEETKDLYNKKDINRFALI